MFLFWARSSLSDFLQAGLHGKISLAESNHFLSGVGVLDDEVTGVAGKFDAFDFAPASFSDADHFEDILEMIGNGVTTVFAGFFCPLDGREKVPVFRVLKCFGHIAGRPVLISVFVKALDLLENRCVRG